MTDSEINRIARPITEHPCYFPHYSKKIAHRSGGHGGTCERCGTLLVDGDCNKGRAGPLSWAPVPRPIPVTGELEIAMWKAVKGRFPIHDGNLQAMIEILAGVARDHKDVSSP